MAVAGRLDAYTEWVSAMSQRDVLRLLDPSIKAPGAIRADKILARVSELLGGVLVEDLPIPYTAVATDLFARKEVWSRRGPVDAAIRASIALPSVITPVVPCPRTRARLFGRVLGTRLSHVSTPRDEVSSPTVRSSHVARGVP